MPVGEKRSCSRFTYSNLVTTFASSSSEILTEFIVRWRDPQANLLDPFQLLASFGLYPSAIGSNDGRCVQMAGTQSEQADDLHLLGIPRSRQTVAITDPHHDKG